MEAYFKDPKHGWGLDNHGEFYESKDGGETWVKIETNGKYEDMYFLDANHGWVTSKEGLFRINTR